MLDITFYIITPFLFIVFVFLVILVSKIYNDNCVNNVYKELGLNILFIESMAQFFITAQVKFENDFGEALKHSKGFLIRSVQDIKADKYKNSNHTIKLDKNKVAVASAYKSFAVVADILTFLDKVNTAKEIETFNSHFEYALNVAITKGKEALALKKEHKK
jgi:hypothetical protein